MSISALWMVTAASLVVEVLSEHSFSRVLVILSLVFGGSMLVTAKARNRSVRFALALGNTLWWLAILSWIVFLIWLAITQPE